jgi:hypothetical protein
MLRDGGAADRKSAGQVANRAWSIGETLEDRSPRGIAQGCKSVA